MEGLEYFDSKSFLTSTLNDYIANEAAKRNTHPDMFLAATLMFNGAMLSPVRVRYLKGRVDKNYNVRVGIDIIAKSAEGKGSALNAITGDDDSFENMLKMALQGQDLKKCNHLSLINLDSSSAPVSVNI